MANDLLQIRVKGQDQVQQRVDALLGAVEARNILDHSAAVLLDHIRGRFLQQVDSGGVPWVVSQAAKRRASGRGGGTLYDTGALFHSLQLFTEGEYARGIGTDVPYGKFHNTGAVGLPQREFLAFGNDDVETVRDVVMNLLQEALNG